MPFDPLSAGVAGAGLILNFIQGQQARKDAARNRAQALSTAQENQAYQRQALAKAMSDAQLGRIRQEGMAGALRFDQFGNATYYDPAQGRWITSFSPTQQAIIDAGEARQRRAQTRGAQAAEDYDRLRAEYLYRQPKTEAQSYQEIVDLINQSQGTGERALSTLMNRFGVRTAGNIPQVVQMDRGPSPGQQLADTMLKARAAALDEYSKRQGERTSRLLPALRQFESTANYVAPVDPTGQAIVGMQQSGASDLLKTGSDYDRLLATIAQSGARSVGSAYDAAVRAAAGTGGSAAAGGPKSSDFLAFAKMLMPEKAKEVAGTTGTRGARASTSGGDEGDGEGGGLAQPAYGMIRPYGDRTLAIQRGQELGSGEYSPIGTYGYPNPSETPDITSGPTIWDKLNPEYRDPYAYDYTTIGGPIKDFGAGRYATPWQF